MKSGDQSDENREVHSLRATCRWTERLDLHALREERGVGRRAQGETPSSTPAARSDEARRETLIGSGILHRGWAGMLKFGFPLVFVALAVVRAAHAEPMVCRTEAGVTHCEAPLNHHRVIGTRQGNRTYFEDNKGRRWMMIEEGGGPPSFLVEAATARWFRQLVTRSTSPRRPIAAFSR